MKLFYKRLGEGEPLLILHGLMGMLDNWQSHARIFAEHFEVYIIDQRNHGHSEHDDVLDYNSMVEDLEEFIDDMFLSDVNIIGHSMGGKVAMKFAQKNPDLINKLLVADIAPRAYPVHHDLIIKGLKSVPLAELKKRTEADQYLAEYIPEVGVRQFLMKNLYWKEKGVLDWRFNLDAIEKNIENMGERIMDSIYHGETLFLRGEKSEYITSEDFGDIELGFPDSEVQTIEGAGHWLHAEKPKEFSELALDFFKK